MKKQLLALALITVSGFASAQRYSYTCEVDMVDIRSNRVIQTFSIQGLADCFEAKKACAKERRMSGRLNTADCIEYGESNHRPGPVNPYPTPGPVNPIPNPNPYPTNGMDARRYLNNGESVIFNNKFATVAGVGFNGSYAVRSNDVWNTMTNGVRRESISVTSGCNLDLCTSDSVIQISSAKYVKVIGLSYDDRFVIQSSDVWNTISSNVDRINLAKTNGCLSMRFGQICTGNTVINIDNRYYTVVGIQANGAVVLRSSDVWNTLTTNVDPMNLVITR